ncbi:MAG: glycosyltransferase family 2 protein [Bacteroidaceae bacterium]|nr:glycosyltransferase family 2 protein [Bacteroidaceae bacterium]
MTLSILIPTYNYNALTLVKALHQLAVREGIEAEIIIGDDASTSETEWMQEAAQLPGVTILRENTNLGRAAIRNHLGLQSTGKWLWFIDADAEVPAEFSLKAGLSAAALSPVVCCGLYHPAENPNPRGTLRYKYERAADKKRSAAQRMKHPHRRLATFNLLVYREVFLHRRFNEKCDKYGYEDALFGVELGRHHIAVAHIDNPLIHIGIDDNDEFLAKSEMAMRSLYKISNIMPRNGGGIVGTSRLLRKWHLRGPVKVVFKLLRRPIRANLLSQHPLLPLFQFYKLGYYLCL